MQIQVKKDKLYQNQDGTWKLGFTVLAEDMPIELVTAEMGRIYHITIVDSDDEAYNAEYTEVDLKPRKLTEMPLSQQAALLCEKEEFQKFIAMKFQTAMSPEGAKEAIIESCQLVRSRAELDTNKRAGEDFKLLITQFEGWKLEQRYGDNLHRYER
jgi:hypothetical protein